VVHQHHDRHSDGHQDQEDDAVLRVHSATLLQVKSGAIGRIGLRWAESGRYPVAIMDDLYDRRVQSALGKIHVWIFAACTVCGQQYPAELRTSEYCSSPCRAKAWRARRKAANAGERDGQ
jgi:hypothetical protein